jgi:hypothetical protein
MYFILRHQLFMDIIEDAVYKMATLLGAVVFCQIYIFDSGNSGGDRFKI